MNGWRTIGGVDWLCAETDDGPRTAELGLVLPFGYAHESPAEIGLTAAVMASLVERINRPLETPDRRIVEPQLATRVGLQETVIAIHGEPEAVRLGAHALEHLLTDPAELDGSGSPDPRRYAWTGWSSELAAWLGVGTVVLAAENDEPWTGDHERFTAFAASLRPGRRAGAIGWTTEPDLLGVVFAAEPDRPTGPAGGVRPLGWREPAPTATAGAVTASFTNNLLSARVPAGPVDDLALQVLSRTVHRSLVTLTRLVETVEVTVEPIGADVLYGLRAVPKEGTTDWFAVREALVQALDASADVVDEVLVDWLSQAQEAAAVSPSLVARAVTAARTGRRPDPAEPDPEAAVLHRASVDDLREAVRRVQAATLVCVPAEHAAPAGRPLFVPAPPPPVERPILRRRSRVALWLRGVPERQRLQADAATLQQTLVLLTRRGQTKGQPGALPSLTSAVDLRSVVARIDRGAEYSTLVDRDDRRLTLVWPAYRRVGALRRLVDEATPAGARIVRPAEPMGVAQLRSDLKKQRFSEVLTTVLLIIAAVLIIWHPVTGQRYQDPVVTTVPVGTVITLGNGSTVQVSDPRWRDVRQSVNPVLAIDVRYCGGGETVDRNTADDARNYLSPQRFSLTGITAASRQIYVLAPGETALKETQLEQGQCTEGTVAFDLDADQPAGISVAYRNGSGDQLQWTL